MAAMVVHFDGVDLGGAHRASHSDREQSDGAAAGNRYRLRRDFSRQNGVHGVTQGIENRRVFLRDAGIQLPDIGFGDHHVLGESAVGIDADDFYVLADVGFAGAALQAFTAGDVHLGGNEIAFLHAGDFVAVGNHFAAELVAGDQRRMNAPLRPAIPFVDVEVGAADGGDFYFDQNIRASEAWDFDLANLGAGGGLRFDHRQHGIAHESDLLRTTRSRRKLFILALADFRSEFAGGLGTHGIPSFATLLHHLAIKFFGLSPRHAERLPVMSAEMFCQKYDLPDVKGVMRQGAIQGLQHSVRFFADVDSFQDVLGFQ